MEEIVSALQQLHKNKIIHLDIKLKNIVIDETMKSFRFIDYGCCYIIPSDDPEQLYDIPVWFTPGCCSPEMVNAAKS